MPWAEYDSGKALVLSLSWFMKKQSLKNDAGFYGEIPVQLEIIKNVPKNTPLILFVNSEQIQKKVEQHILNIRSDVKMRFIVNSYIGTTSDTIWVRDSFPLLVKDQTTKSWKFIAIENRWKIKSEQLNFLNYPVLESGEKTYYGNILADDEYCYTHLSSAADMSDQLKNLIGCKKMITLFPQKGEPGGIYHIDERLKIISNKELLTDVISWKDQLEKYGKKVTLLPSVPVKKVHPPAYLNSTTRTYLNSVILGDTIFIPVFGVSTDKTAIKIYKSFGYKVVPINSSQLSDAGHGSLHCISATLPIGF